MTHWSIQHPLGCCCQPKPSVLPSCIQGDRIVTAHLPLLQAPGHAVFPLLVSSFRPVTPFPAWILSLAEKKILFVFLICVGLPWRHVHSGGSVSLCIFGVVRNYLLGYLMYLWLNPVVFLVLPCRGRGWQLFPGAGGCSSLFPAPLHVWL